MLYRKTLIIAALCSLAFAMACSKKKERVVVNTIDTQAIRSDSSLTKEDKSERLALAAEQLVSPGSFMYADDVAEEALSIDANNKRAQLVKALIGPMMATKGILARVKTLSDTNEQSKQKYDLALEKLEKVPNHALKTFATEGVDNIKTEKDVQAFVDTIKEAYNKQRLFFKTNKDLDLTFNLSDLFSAAALNKDDDDNCYWDYNENGIYQEYCWNEDGIDGDGKEPVVLEYKMNRADNEALQQISAGIQIYLTILNSYDLSGSISVNEKYQDTNTATAQIREELLKDKSFGTLRNNTLKTISSLGLDAISGIRWAKTIQNEICPSGEAVKGSRPGHVFSKGICIKDSNSSTTSLEKILSSVELALNGKALRRTFKGETSSYTTDVKADVVLGSVNDVRDLELGFNSCDKLVNAGDNTLGGTFPKKDANVIINLNSHACYE